MIWENIALQLGFGRSIRNQQRNDPWSSSIPRKMVQHTIGKNNLNFQTFNLSLTIDNIHIYFHLKETTYIFWPKKKGDYIFTGPWNLTHKNKHNNNNGERCSTIISLLCLLLKLAANKREGTGILHHNHCNSWSIDAEWQ